MILSRRHLVKMGAVAGAALVAPRFPLAGRRQAPLTLKAVPSSGERLPVIGLGSWRTFNVDPSSPEGAEPREVVRLFHELGGKVLDTAPSYGRSEAFVGAAVRDLGVADDLFVATKVNVEDRGGEAAREQMERSSEVLGKHTVDLMQVWNLGDSVRRLTDRYLDAHLEAARAWRAAGRSRYVGVTTSFPRQYEALEAALRRHDLDFVQLDYSIGHRVPEERLLPLAADRGMAVIANRPFTTGNLFASVRGKPLPPWAAEFDCASWAQFFLKYVIGHPAVTVAIPGTRRPEHVIDNLGAARGRLPDQALRRRMEQYFEGL